MKTTALLTCLAIALAFGGGTYLALAAAPQPTDGPIEASRDPAAPGPAAAAAADARATPDRYYFSVRVDNRGDAETANLEVSRDGGASGERQLLLLSPRSTVTLTQEVGKDENSASLWNPLFSASARGTPGDCTTGAVQVTFVIKSSATGRAISVEPARCIEPPQ